MWHFWPEITAESPLRVEKRLTIEGGSVEARYRLIPRGDVAPGRWGVQWNLAVTAGEGPGRRCSRLCVIGPYSR